MKNLVVLIIFVGYFFTSCNRRYICTCTITGTINVNEYDLYNSKWKARKNCNKLSNSTQSCALEEW